MSGWKRFFTWRLTPDFFDLRLGQAVCFAGGPAVLAIALYKLATLPLSQTEAMLGILCSLTLCMTMILMGLVLPLAQGRKVE